MLAKFVDKGRLNTILTVALGIVVPFAFLFGGAAVSMATLRRGLVDGMLSALLGWSVIALLVIIDHGEISAVLLVFLVLLVTVSGLSFILGRTNSLELVLLSGLGLALLVLAAVWLAVDDPIGYWRETTEQGLDALVAVEALTAANKQVMMDSLQFQAITGNFIVMLLLLTYGAVFLGRSWQAQMVNPGGFRQAFHRLQLGRGLAVMTALVFMATALTESGWLLNAAAILIWLWVLQGLAVIHAIIGGLKASSGWLVATYLVLTFGWSVGVPVALAVPLLGLTNQFFDVRGPLLRNSDNGE
jgi:hypothetical protein